MQFEDIKGKIDKESLDKNSQSFDKDLYNYVIRECYSWFHSSFMETKSRRAYRDVRDRNSFFLTDASAYSSFDKEGYLGDSYKDKDYSSVKSNLMHRNMKAYVAMMTKKNNVPSFGGYNTFEDEAKGYVLDKIAQSDSDNYINRVGIEARIATECFKYGSCVEVLDYVSEGIPYTRIISPKTGRFPDISADYIENNYRYHFFVRFTTKEELILSNQKANKDIYFNLDNLMP